MNDSSSIVLGGGCFWCVEAIFKKVKGVRSVQSGYSGGEIENPTYEQVCTGESGFAEVVKVEFDEDIISLEEVLQIFLKTHDPTTLNRQGNDVGPQYRSAIFYNSNVQKEAALAAINNIEKSKYYSDPVVTEVTELKNFYSAEEYHQNYYEQNRNQPYCRIVIDPKVKKFMENFKEKLL